MINCRKLWNSTIALLAVLAVMIADFDAKSTVSSFSVAYADDDGGGGRGRGGGRDRGRDGSIDDDSPAIFQVFRNRRPRQRRAARAVLPVQHEPAMLIASGLGDEMITTLTADGYRVVERHRLALPEPIS